MEFEFQVEQGKIKELALAIGDNNPIYYSMEAAKEKGFRTIPAPPTFPTVMDMWGGMDFEHLVKMLEVNPLHVLHGEQEYEYHQMIYAGDFIKATVKVISRKARMGMTFIIIETTYTRDGECVVIGRSTVIERGGDAK